MHVQSTLGVQIAVHDLGGTGERLLVSHATGFHGRCYEPMAAALAHRFHSVAFDYRGHGDTPRPDGPVDWERYGDDAEAMARWMAAMTELSRPAPYLSNTRRLIRFAFGAIPRKSRVDHRLSADEELPATIPATRPPSWARPPSTT